MSVYGKKRSLEDTQVLTGAKNRENKLHHVHWRLRFLANVSFLFLKIHFNVTA